MITFTLTSDDISILERGTGYCVRPSWGKEAATAVVLSHSDGTYTLDRETTDRMKVLAEDVVEAIDDGWSCFDEFPYAGGWSDDCWLARRIAHNISTALGRVLRDATAEDANTTS